MPYLLVRIDKMALFGVTGIIAFFVAMASGLHPPKELSLEFAGEFWLPPRKVAFLFRVVLDVIELVLLCGIKPKEELVVLVDDRGLRR